MSVKTQTVLGEQKMLADVEVNEDLTEASVKLPGFTSKDLNRKRMCSKSYLFDKPLAVPSSIISFSSSFRETFGWRHHGWRHPEKS